MYPDIDDLSELYKDPAAFAAVYIRYHEKERPRDNDPDLTASEYMDRLVRTDPYKALRLMDEVIATSDNPRVLGFIGAGPLEDLLGSERGAEVLDSVIDRARQNKKWRLPFGCVWTSRFKDKAAADKIEKQVKKFFPKGRP